jgi:hypothetical protein
LFEPVSPLDPGPVAAVDGSHAVLVDNGAVWVAAVRAAATPWPGAPRAEVPVRLVAAAAADGPDQVARAYEAAGLLAPTVRNAEAWAEAHRALAELDAAHAALDALPTGGLLLMDGALHQLPRGPQQAADRLLAQAGTRGVRVLGVAKRSGLLDPADPALAAAPRSAWRLRLADGIHACRLHGAAPHVFRVDGDAADLGRLLPLSRDAVYAGYPYPLALAHNRVAIAQAHARELAAALDARLRSAGALRAIADFHEVLDRNT